jgi:glutamate:GABA antiporter
MQFLPILIFNLFGFELIASAGDEIKNPSRNLPKAMVIATIVIGALYIFATFGMLVALPPDAISLDQGLLDVLQRGFASLPFGNVAVAIIAVGILLTLLSTMVTWTSGLNRLTQEAAETGDMPAAFGWSPAHLGTPIGANIATGILGTFLLFLVPTSSAVEDIFWELVSLCSLIFLVPYSMIFLAFLRLRYTHPDHHRPFRVPGGQIGAIIASVLVLIVIVQAMVLFVYAPGSDLSITHTVQILIGFSLMLLVGEIIQRISPVPEA